MSKVIVRMEMPGSCRRCAVSIGNNRLLCAIDHHEFEYSDEVITIRRDENCPILAVLPEKHGRLGDLDELAAGCDAPYWCRWLSEIEDAPTIVPATGGGNHEAD